MRCIHRLIGIDMQVFIVDKSIRKANKENKLDRLYWKISTKGNGRMKQAIAMFNSELMNCPVLFLEFKFRPITIDIILEKVQLQPRPLNFQLIKQKSRIVKGCAFVFQNSSYYY